MDRSEHAMQSLARPPPRPQNSPQQHNEEEGGRGEGGRVGGQRDSSGGAQKIAFIFIFRSPELNPNECRGGGWRTDARGREQ